MRSAGVGAHNAKHSDNYSDFFVLATARIEITLMLSQDFPLA